MGIRMVPEQFDQDRRQDPKKADEGRVFDALQNLDLDGHCLYEFSYRRGGVQVDHALWLDNLGRFSVQVKGPGQWRPAYGGLGWTRTMDRVSAGVFRKPNRYRAVSDTKRRVRCGPF